MIPIATRKGGPFSQKSPLVEQFWISAGVGSVDIVLIQQQAKKFVVHKKQTLLLAMAEQYHVMIRCLLLWPRDHPTLATLEETS